MYVQNFIVRHMKVSFKVIEDMPMLNMSLISPVVSIRFHVAYRIQELVVLL